MIASIDQRSRRGGENGSSATRRSMVAGWQVAEVPTRRHANRILAAMVGQATGAPTECRRLCRRGSGTVNREVKGASEKYQ